MPTITEKGLSQSIGLPANSPPETLIPVSIAPSMMPCESTATRLPKKNALSHGFFRAVSARNSKATPRKMSPMINVIKGMYRALASTPKSTGKAAKMAAPPKTSQVWLASQTGEIVAINVVRSFSSACGRKEKADAETDAVEQHVEDHRKAHQSGPYVDKEHHSPSGRSRSVSRTRIPAGLWTGGIGLVRSGPARRVLSR